MSKRDGEPGETVTLSKEQFEMLLATRGQEGGITEAALERILTRVQPPGPHDGYLTKERQAELRALPARAGYKVCDVLSELGARAQMWTRRGPNGEHIPVDMLPGSYRYPPKILVHVKDGGLCPDGMQIAKDETAAMLIATSGKEVADLIPHLAFPCLQWLLTETIWFDKSSRGWFKPGGLKKSDLDPDGKGFEQPWDDEMADAAE